ncbi:hypothetical protein FRC17_009236, partial [Serendipita sp. 399]
MLPLALCTANQFVSGLEYKYVEDVTCSHSKDGEGGISALFGDLSSLKDPSRVELHVVVQVVLWRNRPLDEQFQSIWRDLESGRWAIRRPRGFDDPKLPRDTKLKLCVHLCGTAWFAAYMDRQDRRQGVIHMIEEVSRSGPWGPSIPSTSGLLGLLDSIRRAGDDDATKTRLNEIKEMLSRRSSAIMDKPI